MNVPELFALYLGGVAFLAVLLFITYRGYDIRLAESIKKGIVDGVRILGRDMRI